MSPKTLRAIIWAVLWLVLLEVGLEYRAYRRGYRTILFGKTSVAAAAEDRNAAAQPNSDADTDASNAPKPAKLTVGPTPDFPFRGFATTRVKPPGTTRIWFASASHARDDRMPADRIFPSLVQTDLTQAGLQVDTINASLAGYTIDVNTQALRTTAPQWSPDIVVLYQLSTDLRDLAEQARAGVVPSAPGDGHSAEAATGSAPPATPIAAAPAQDNPLEMKFIQRGIENLTLYPLIKGNISARLTGERLLPNELDPAFDAVLLGDIEALIDQAEAIGAQPVLCTFAFSNNADNLDQMPSDFSLALLRYSPDLSLVGWVTMVDRLNEGIRELAHRHGIPLCDLGRIVGGKTQYFRDTVHFTAKGHEEVAKAIAETIEPLIEPSAEGDNDADSATLDAPAADDSSQEPALP